MSRQNMKYIIPLKSLEDGIHEMSFKIDKAFIEVQKIEEMLDADVTVKIIFTKRTQVHSIDLELEGIVEMPCDRCLDPLKIFIKNSQTFIVKIAATDDEFADSEDVILVSQNEKDLDISQLLYEYLLLSLPLKKVHEENTCNSFMTSYLDTNEQKTKEQTYDPRWDSLKNIFKN